jgi:branched-chain amino acid transport system permease protein
MRLSPSVVSGRTLWVVPAIGGLLLLLAPWLGVGAGSLRQVIVISLLALCASGLNLAWGYAGELAVGQLAMYCMGAYVSGWMSVHGYDLAYALVASAAAAAVLGLVVGLPSLRFGGWGLAMSSFFLIVLIPNIVGLFPSETGGQIGLIGIGAPVLFGLALSNNGFYVVVIVCLIAWLAIMRNLVTSRHGSALKVVRDNPVLASALGLNVRRLKLSAYVIGAIPAGVAGALFVFLDRFISPDSFGFDAAVLIIAASVLGGLETVYGAVFGAAILTIIPDNIASFNQYADIVYGAFLVLGGALLANDKVRLGVAQLKRRALDWRLPPNPGGPSTEIAMTSIPGASLTVQEVSKSFGGVSALKSVSLEAKPGEITALIGANGSGKTTLLNIISGYYKCDSGTVFLGSDRLPLGQPMKVARMGVARSFQTPIIPRSMTTAEAVSVGRYSHDYAGLLTAMLRLPRYARVRARDTRTAQQWLRATGLSHEERALASALPLGSRRLLEVARALASGGGVLLLDEVASGLDTKDIGVLGDLMREIRNAGATIVLVEHNFSLVCDVADTIYVLDRGALITHGTPDEVRNDEAVARSYLGELAAPPEVPPEESPRDVDAFAGTTVQTAEEG